MRLNFLATVFCRGPRFSMDFKQTLGLRHPFRSSPRPISAPFEPFSTPPPCTSRPRTRSSTPPPHELRQRSVKTSLRLGREAVRGLRGGWHGLKNARFPQGRRVRGPYGPDLSRQELVEGLHGAQVTEVLRARGENSSEKPSETALSASFLACSGENSRFQASFDGKHEVCRPSCLLQSSMTSFSLIFPKWPLKNCPRAFRRLCVSQRTM